MLEAPCDISLATESVVDSSEFKTEFFLFIFEICVKLLAHGLRRGQEWEPVAHLVLPLVLGSCRLPLSPSPPSRLHLPASSG